MTTPLPPATTGTVVLVSDDERSARWLGQALASAALLRRVPTELDTLGAHLEREAPAAVVIDFQHVESERATQLAHGAAQACPGAVLAAMGRSAEPSTALAALRAGAREFLDVDAAPDEAAALLLGLMRGASAAGPAVRGKVVALLGARCGMGTSTLAAHLAVRLQRGQRPGHQAALLDLGLPIGDSHVMLETRGSYSFAEAVRNQHRLDATFVQTALPRHASGLQVLALPNSVSELRELTHAAAIAVVQRLRGLFDMQVIDLGGFASAEFVAQVAAASDECLLVCDQAATSIVSALEVVRGLRARQLKPKLVVNKVGPGIDPQPLQIAERLELPLAAALPHRHAELLRAVNAGQLLVDTAPQDPYTLALEGLATRLQSGPSAPTPAGVDAPWRRLLARMPFSKA